MTGGVQRNCCVQGPCGCSFLLAKAMLLGRYSTVCELAWGVDVLARGVCAVARARASA